MIKCVEQCDKLPVRISRPLLIIYKKEKKFLQFDSHAEMRCLPNRGDAEKLELYF